ncbi:acyltransferase domain-containing protein [Pseudonocardia endophytica]|uniref:Acyl transferase family protein n=1 Tax=Pseudonocardia endophytica TaxID=401976 RepID=A0A4R1HP93_PSEEN|nr:acyltransferase domain-containing protein [Pseudonocardia endophytica]TCK22210.1 acyl transferase family protein [Pseudonocardia endophytica]
MSTTETTLPVVLAFPGQGAQHPRMAAGLYGHDEVFTGAMDAAFDGLGPDVGPRVRDEWLAATPSADFADVTVAQPLLYAVNHALGRMVLSWGVRPVALFGHSVGEMVAATLAGVIPVEDGVELMRTRQHQFASTPAGGMLAVAASVADVEDVLEGDVHLAAVNAPRQLLLAGESGPLDRAARTLRERGVTCVPAEARQAFHSPVVAGAVEQSRPDWRRASLRAPQTPVYSAYTGSPIGLDEALDPDFWARQPGETVMFASILDQVLADHDCLVVEAGPGRSLATLAMRHPAVRAGRSEVLAVLPERHRGDDADRSCVEDARRRLTGPSTRAA